MITYAMPLSCFLLILVILAIFRKHYYSPTKYCIARKYGFVFWWKSFLPFSLWRLLSTRWPNSICSIQIGIYLKSNLVKSNQGFLNNFKEIVDHFPNNTFWIVLPCISALRCVPILNNKQQGKRVGATFGNVEIWMLSHKKCISSYIFHSISTCLENIIRP